MSRTSRRLLFLLTTFLALALAAPAQAAVSVSVAPTARIVDSGAAAIARVTVTCDRGDQPLEGQLTLSQDDQTISGLGGIPVRCDGRPHKARVRVNAQQGLFHPGDAFASAFVLVLNPDGTTEQGQATGTVTLR
jgi:hypothetical protein